jgi:tetratricopeptide (TPR) repeat protein
LPRMNPVEQLTRQVRRAQRWLGVQRFFGVLGWCLFVTLLVAVAIIAVDKYRPLGLGPWIQYAGAGVGFEPFEPWVVELLKAGTWAVAALGLGILAAVVLAVVRGRGPIDAAIEIDRRFQLKERVSSTLAMSADERRTALGQALTDDAVRHVGRIDVGEHFGVFPGRQMLLPLIPAALAILVALLPRPAAVDNPANAAAVKKQVQESSETLLRTLVEQRKKAQELGLKDAQNRFHRLEEATEDLADQTQGDRKQALVKLNDLARQLERRRQDLGGAEAIQKQLEQLKNIARGPEDKLLEAIGRGDFKKAINELEALKEKLADGKLTDKERENLAKQLGAMKDKLQKLVDAHREAQDDLQKNIDQLRQGGQFNEADKLQEQLDKLRSQLPEMDQLEDLADKLGQCGQCLKQGQLQDAGDMLNDLQGDLEGLREQLQELEMLDEAMDGLAQSREQMTCPHCGGLGCGACQGDRPGEGLGAGRGKGDRPEQEEDVSFYDTQAAVKIGPGAGYVVGEADGPNVRGKFQEQIQEQVESARRQSADPLTGQQIPRKHRQHAREYFNRLREGE